MPAILLSMVCAFSLALKTTLGGRNRYRQLKSDGRKAQEIEGFVQIRQLLSGEAKI